MKKAQGHKGQATAENYSLLSGREVVCKTKDEKNRGMRKAS